MKLSLTFETKMWLFCGLLLMLFVSLFRYKKYNLNIYKLFSSSIMLFVSGILGLNIMFFIENGFWGGISFYGTILIGPIILFPLLYLIKIPFFDVLSLYTPCICIMHILMKMNCYRIGCCSGNEVYNSIVPIPLQVLEALAILIIMLLLLLFEKKVNKRYIFPVYLILYGVIRFVLNLFRDNITIFYYLPIGNIWSIVSILFGILLICYLYKKRGFNYD